jgi:hypothetical protein
MKLKLISVLLIVILSTLFSFLGSYLYNSFTTKKESPREEKVLNHLKDSLALTENQYCKMKECQECFKDSLTNISCKIHKQRIELITLLKGNNPDRELIHNIMNRIDSLQSFQLHKIVDNILNQKNILDETQRDKFFRMLLSQVSDDNKSCIINNNH